MIDPEELQNIVHSTLHDKNVIRAVRELQEEVKDLKGQIFSLKMQIGKANR